MDKEFPELTVITGGSSGIEIRTMMPKQFDCLEFTLTDKRPVSAFISPWMQFEPAELQEFRLKLAHEIARRAAVHDELIKKITTLEEIIRAERESIDKREITQQTTYRMWREDRAKMGLPEDFSDIKNWPPEMLSTYR